MNLQWINKDQNEACILFFNGWGMDEHVIHHIDHTGFDVCMISNYLRLNPFFEDMTGYRKVYVIAWSMGVWAAEHILSQSQLQIYQSIAICGTSNPINDQYGIPEDIFELTLESWNEANRTKFYRKMMGGEKILNEYRHFLSKRTVKDQKDELKSIYVRHWNNSECLIAWDLAVVAKNDLIFRPGNQLNWWQGKTRIVETSQPHFPFLELKKWDQLLMLQ